MIRLFKFIKFYFEPDDKYVRGIAYNAARQHFNVPVRNESNPNPRPIDYERRREAFLRYQRAFNHSYRLDYAKMKLGIN